MSKVLPWSFSSLNAFEQCPRRYNIIRIQKLIKEGQTEATLHGNEVHKALELGLKGEQVLPKKYEQWEPLVQRIRKAPGKKLVEYKFALTKGFRATEFFAKDAWVRGVIDAAVLGVKSATVLDWKGLALDTPLPTPSGWTTMAAVKEGDELFGSDGQPCRVVGKSQVHNRDTYRLTFDDGCSVVADDQHLWCVNGEVISTVEVARTLVKNGQKWRAVSLAAPLSTATKTLPIHPYVLGCWLGDGKHTSGEICKPDQALWDNIVACGYTVGPPPLGDKARCSTVRGLRTQLRLRGLLGNKHMPKEYLRASVADRVSLLQGLMDTDGSVNPTRKQLVFSTCDKQLSDDVFELLVSLGQRPLQSKTKQTGFGKTVTAWPISFRVQGDLIAFRLPRKADRVGAWGAGHSYRRVVVSVDRVDNVPTQCIAVDSPDNTYLCTKWMLPTHNTGKPKPDVDQLKLFAGVTLSAYPYLESVNTGYVWLAHNRVDSQVFTKADVPGIWQEFIPRVQRLERALEKDDWPPKPSGLCAKWCPVGRKLCEFCGVA